MLRPGQHASEKVATDQLDKEFLDTVTEDVNPEDSSRYDLLELQVAKPKDVVDLHGKTMYVENAMKKMFIGSLWMMT